MSQLEAARNRISDDAETMNRLCARNGEAAAIIADLMELVALYRKQWKPLSAEDEDIGKALYRADKFLDAKPERRSIADKELYDAHMLESAATCDHDWVRDGQIAMCAREGCDYVRKPQGDERDRCPKNHGEDCVYPHCDCDRAP